MMKKPGGEDKYATFKKADQSGRNQGESVNDNNSGQYVVGPGVGGSASNTQGGVPRGGTKKQVFKAKMRVNKTQASPQAKRAARNAYGH